MYHPRQNTIPERFSKQIVYHEYPPSFALTKQVSSFWELRTTQLLKEDFSYLILPDACIDMVFDLSNPSGFEGVLLMTPHDKAINQNIGKSFSYFGIRFLPGAWLYSPKDIVKKSLVVDKLGKQNLKEFRQKLTTLSLSDRLILLEQLVVRLTKEHIVGESVGLESFLADSEKTPSVGTIATFLGYSRRQVQRFVQDKLGFRPHHFLRILRFQSALKNPNEHSYFDQSHLIREFKSLTGMTPGKFESKYKKK